MGTETKPVKMAVTHRALQIDEICEHVFSFLRTEDIKKCRLVNKSWKFVANRFMRRNSVITFKFRRNNVKNINEMRQKMIQISRTFILSKRQPDRTPFSCFLFQGVIPIELFVTFMRKNRKCVRELKIFGVLKDPRNPMRANYDISDLLHPTLRKLEIDWHFPSFKYLITPESIRFINDLKIGNCGIVLDAFESRISPTEVCLKESVAFLKDGKPVEGFILNELFDFRHTKTIVLDNTPGILDFGPCADGKFQTKMERVVKLVDTKIMNWELCNWKINILALNNVSLNTKNQMDIQDLRCHEGIIDLSVIHEPRSIVSVALHYETELLCKKLFHFPHLTRLCLNNDCLKFLHYFAKHDSIKKVHLISTLDDDDDSQYKVNIRDLPPKIETLQLEEVRIDGDEPYPLLELYLSDYETIDKFQTVLSKFRPEWVYLVNFDILYFDIDEVVKFVKKPKPYEYLTIGKFDWSKNSFKDSMFSEVVDEEGETYLFKGESQSELDQLGRGKWFCYCDIVGTPASPVLLERLHYLEQIH